MLVVVVAAFLLVEFPTGVNMSIMIIENTGSVVIVDQQTRALLELFTNLVIVLSYPLNFFIYCAMSRQFRQTFCGLFAGVFTRVGVPPALNGASVGGAGGGAWESSTAFVGGVCGGRRGPGITNGKSSAVQYASLSEVGCDLATGTSHGCAVTDDVIPLTDIAKSSVL